MDRAAVADSSAGLSRDACVIVPMFNEGQVVGEVVRNLKQHFAHVICVDDGSSDDSMPAALREGAVVVSHVDNYGQGAALQTGIQYALARTDAKFIVTFDADGQHGVLDAVSMVNVARQGKVDIVLGSRFLSTSPSVPFWRRLLLRMAVAMTRTSTGLRLTDTHNGLRVMTRQVAASLNLQLNGMAHASEILDAVARHGWTYEEFPVAIAYTEYSMAKGQGSINAVNIAFDLMMARVRANA